MSDEAMIEPLLKKKPIEKAVVEQSDDHIDILGVHVSLKGRQWLLDVVQNAIRSNERCHVSYANIHTINLSQNISWFRDHLNASLITYCDGQGVRLGASLLGRMIDERVTLIECISDICSLAQRQGWKLFFVGSSTETLERALEQLKRQFPALQIAGSHHGYFEITNGIDVVAAINKAKPDIVFVGMGVPLQEDWIRKNIQSLDTKILWSSGGLFECIAGNFKRCPRWMASVGLEWFYRLLQEPRRLWKRYLIGNPLFLYRVVRERHKPRVPSR